MSTAPLAVFDLDGTLVRGDSCGPFLVSYARRNGRLWKLPLLLWPLALYTLRILSDRAIKERAFQAILAGQPLDRVAEHAAWFCRTWLPGRWWPDVVARLRWHQSSGHRVLILSASPDVYVPLIGRELGVAEVLCTRVAAQDGVCQGSIVGDNCKGEAKVDVLVAHLGQATLPPGSYAYGDRQSDLPVLRRVDHGFWAIRGQLRPVAG